MYNAVMINMKDKYPVYELLEKKFIEITFENNIETVLNSITDYNIVMYYSEKSDSKLINKLRKACNFLHIIIVHFVKETISFEENEKLQQAGANLLEQLPKDTDTLTNHLLNFTNELDQKNNFYDKDLNPFKLAIKEIFSTMAFLDLNFVDAYYIPNLFHLGTVSGMMKLGGENKGNIVITMNYELAQKLISNIMAIPTSDLLKSDIEDGVAELINMTAGGAKARLTDNDEHFLLSAPTILTDHDSEKSTIDNADSVILNYSVENLHFAVMINLASLHK